MKKLKNLEALESSLPDPSYVRRLGFWSKIYT